MDSARLFVTALACGLLYGCSASNPNEVKPPNWPNLTTIETYPNPFGETCTIDGTTQRGGMPTANRTNENELKNRFYPPSSYQPYTVYQMLRLPNDQDNSLEQTGIALTGFVKGVKPGGTNGESCNCEASGKGEVDAHIEVITDPKEDNAEGQGMIVVEVTERSRRLAALGLLPTTIGNDWTTEQLKRQITGKWVRFSGWLLYDTDHVKESWNVDPEDGLGRRNWRGTPWEVHPVMGIEVLVGGSPNSP